MYSNDYYLLRNCINIRPNSFSLSSVFGITEPGYYLDGSWGIRIENQVVVVGTQVSGVLPYR